MPDQDLLDAIDLELKAGPPRPFVPPGHPVPDPGAVLAGAKSSLGEPLPPLQGFTYGTHIVDVTPPALSASPGSGLAPRVEGFPVVSPAVLENIPDSFRDDINQLYKDRGLELPDIKPGDTERFHRWERVYLGKIEQVDAPTHERLKQATFNQERPFLRDWQKSMRILYLAQSSDPTPTERDGAIARAWFDWRRADFRPSFSDLDPADAQRPYRPPAQDLHAKVPIDLVLRMVDKISNNVPPESFTPEERQLSSDALSGGAFARFAISRIPYYATLNRLDLLNGSPAQSPDPIIYSDELDKPTMEKARRDAAWEQQGVVFPWTPLDLQVHSSIPFKADLTHLDIAPAVPFLADLAQQSSLIQQQQKESRAKAALERAFKVGLPGGQGGALAAMADPEAAAAAQAFMKQRSQGDVPLDLAKLGTDLEKIQKDNPYLDPKARYEFFKSTSETGMITAPVVIGALAAGIDGALIGALGIGALELLNSGTDPVGRGAATLIGADPGSWDAYAKALPTNLYRGLVSLFDPKGTEQLAYYDRFWRDTLPVSSPLYDELDSNSRLRASVYTQSLLRRLGDPAYTVNFSKAMDTLGLSNPYLQSYLGEFAEGMLDQAIPLVLAGLGTHALFRASRGFPALDALKDPMTRFTPEELIRAANGGYSPLSPAMRAPLLQVIVKEVQGLDTPDAARGVLTRLNKELNARGPLDPALTASVQQIVQETRDSLAALSGTDLSPHAKSALAKLPPVLADLGPTEGWYAATGKIPSLGKIESTRTAEMLKTYLDRLELNAGAPVPGWVEERFGRNLPTVIDGIRTEQQRKTDFVRRRDAILDITNPLLQTVEKENALARTEISDFMKHRATSVMEWNNMHLQAAAKLEALAKGTPLDLPRANPAVFTQKFNQIFEASADGKLRELYRQNLPLFELVYGDLAPKYRAAAKKGAIPESTLVTRTDAWLNDNLRPDRQTFTSLDELKKAKRFYFDPRSASPSSIMPDYIAEKAAQAIAKGEPVSLGPKQFDLLNLVREVPHDSRRAQGNLSKLLASIDQTLDKKRARLEVSKKFSTDIQHFLERVAEDPDRPRKFPITPRLLTQLEARLGAPDWLVGDDSRTHVSWVPELSFEQRTGLEVFQEATKSVPPEIEQLRQGYRRFGSIEQAAASIQNPAGVTYLLRQQLNTANGIENYFRFRWLKTMEILEKELTPEGFQKVLTEVATHGESSTNPDAGRLWQAHQLDLLYHSYASGLIPEAKYQELIQNKNYFRSVFEQETPGGPHSPLLPTARFAELKVDPSPFKFKIPHDSWYVAWNEGGVLKHQAGFKDQAAAQKALLAKDLPPLTEAGVYAPWKLSSREVAGTIIDAGTSGYDLTNQLGYDIAKSYFNQALSQSSFVKNEMEARSLRSPTDLPGAHFVDGQGVQWYYMDPTKTRAPGLTGKYISEHVINWLKDSSARYGWVQRTAEEIQRGTGFWDLHHTTWGNPLLTRPTAIAKFVLGVPGIGPATSLAGKAYSAVNHVFTLSRLPLSLSMPTKQLASNWLWNMPLMGLDPNTPLGFLHTSEYFAKGARALSDPRTALSDPILNELVRNGNLDYSKIAFDHKAAKHLENNWNSVAGLKERYTRLREAEERLLMRDSDQATFEKEYPPLHAKLVELDAEITKQSGSGASLFGGIVDHIADTSKASLSQLVDLTTGAGGKEISQALFHYIGIWDDLAKYAAHSFNRLNRGMTEHQSLGYIDHFGQNLQRTPEPIRGLSQSALGTRFSSYPFNFYMTAFNAAKFRPGFTASRLGLLALTNFGTILARKEDPREFFAHYARVNKYGAPSAASNLLSLLTTLQLPGGGALDLNSIWGPFEGQSPMARRMDELTTRSTSDPSTSMILQILSHVGSKFVGSNPLTSVLAQFATKVDQRGRPLRTWGDQLRGISEIMLPDLTPGVGREAEEIHDWLTTPYQDPYTGEQKSKVTFTMKRLLSYIPAGEQNSAARLRAVMDSVQFQQPARHQDAVKQMFEDGLDRTLWAEGAHHDDGSLDLEKARPIVQKWAANPANARALVRPDGSLFFEQRTPQEIQETIKQIAEHPTIQFRSFARATFADQLDYYALWRSEEAHPDPKFHAAIVAQIAQKVLNAHPEVTHLAMNELRFTRELLESPELPPDAKSLIQGWIATSVQHAIQAEMNRAGKAPPAR